MHKLVADQWPDTCAAWSFVCECVRACACMYESVCERMSVCAQALTVLCSFNGLVFLVSVPQSHLRQRSSVCVRARVCERAGAWDRGQIYR
jgi:hypothetical protein